MILIVFHSSVPRGRYRRDSGLTSTVDVGRRPSTGAVLSVGNAVQFRLALNSVSQFLSLTSPLQPHFNRHWTHQLSARGRMASNNRPSVSKAPHSSKRSSIRTLFSEAPPPHFIWVACSVVPGAIRVKTTTSFSPLRLHARLEAPSI